MKNASGIIINPASVRNKFVDILKLDKYIINKFAHCYHQERLNFTEDIVKNEYFIYNCYNDNTLYPDQLLQIVYNFIDYSKVSPTIINFDFSPVELVRVLHKKIQKEMVNTINNYYRLTSTVDNYTPVEIINIYSYIIVCKTINIYNLIKIYYDK